MEGITMRDPEILLCVFYDVLVVKINQFVYLYIYTFLYVHYI